MHFTRNGAFGPSRQPVLVLERGEGPYVFDTHGNRYFDALSALFCSQLGYSYGEELAAAAASQMAKLPFATTWSMAHPAAAELSGRLAGSLADRVMLYVGVTPEAVQWALGHVHEGARSAGRDPAELKISRFLSEIAAHSGWPANVIPCSNERAGSS